MKEQNLQAVKEILKINSKALRGMHDTFGIDFEKELTIKEVQMPKTLNRIIQENNITDETTNYLLIQKVNYRGQAESYFRVIIFDENAKYKINGFWTNYSCGIDEYYRKTDFEADRKRNDLRAFLIVIPKQYNNIYNELYEYSRFNYKNKQQEKLEESYKEDKQCIFRAKYNKQDVKTVRYSDNTISVYGFNYVKIDNYKGDINVIYDTYRFRGENIKTEHDLIDKSGYNVFAKRCDLKRKLELIKERRNRKQIIQTDFLSANCELLQEINRVRNLLANKLLNVDMFTDDFGKIKTKLNELQWVINDYKCHEKLLNTVKNNEESSYWKRYHTVDEIKKAMEEIKLKLQNIEKEQ